MTPPAATAFHTTRWTLILRAQGCGEEARLALSELCAIYYEPILQFIRHWCRNPEEAKDLAHGFFADLLARESPGMADQMKGRFRGYLLAAVKHWLSHQRERTAAAKRGGRLERVSIDEAGQLASQGDWDHQFDRAWALAMIRCAHEELRSEMEAAGKAHHFEVLQPWLDGGSPGDPTAAAAKLQLSANALKVAIHRLRERFRQKIRAGIAATVPDPSDAADEFRHLVEVLVKN